LLEKLDQAGFGKDELSSLQKLTLRKKRLVWRSGYVFNSEIKPITRERVAAAAQATIFALLNDKQEFIEFVLTKVHWDRRRRARPRKTPISQTNISP
jgi:type I restriction enzyme R subunit